MQIHDLNTKALTNPAYVAFDDGTDTYKADFKAEIDNAAADAVADADLTDNTVAFTSGDSASPTGWTAVSVLTSGLSLKTLFNRISTMVKNVRYIWSKIGTASMGTTATTITGAIAEHESDISTLNSKTALSNVKYFGDDRHVRYRRTGNICIVEVEGYTVASTGTLSLGTLPVEDRPLTTAQAILKIGTSPVSGWIIQSSGVVYVNAPTTGNLAGEFVFFVE